MESKPLTIVGRGVSWYSCPFEGEVWGTATCLVTPGMEDKRYDKVFAFDTVNYELANALEVAKERHIPVVSGKDYATELYPLREIWNEFQTGYLRNSISYMLALAILRKYKKLNLYGVDQEGLYEEGRAYVTFWLGMAFGRGIDFASSNFSLPHYRITTTVPVCEVKPSIIENNLKLVFPEDKVETEKVEAEVVEI